MLEEEKTTAETTVEENEAAVAVYADDDQYEQEVNEEEFTDEVGNEDSKSVEGEAEEKELIPMSKEQQSENARRRREAERQAEIARVRAEAQEQAILDTLNHKNPYTGKEMKDSHDVKEYLDMRRIEKEGGDPLSDYSNFLKERARVQEEQARQQEEQKNWFNEDKKVFIQNHPEVNLRNLLQNDQFQRYASGKVGSMPLSDIYDGFMQMIEEYEGKAKKLAKQMLANQKASVGSLSTTSNTNKSKFFTKEQVEKMTPEEVSKNYPDIRASMAKW